MYRSTLFCFLLLFLPITLFAQVPNNDLCADAITVACGDIVTGDTTMATEVDEPAECGAFNNGAAGGVWYNIAGTGDIITLSLCNDNNFDTQIEVYSGDCNSQVCIGGNDQACGNQSEFSFTSNDSTNYLVYIYGWADSVGTYQLDVTCQTPPPPLLNDLCADAIVITCGGSLSGTTAGATDTGEPTDLCGVFNNGSSPGVWYSFVGTGDLVTVSLCGSDFDTQLQVFEGDCNSTTCVTGNDDNFAACGAGNNSELTFASTLSINYLIYINGLNTSEGNFNIEITCETQSTVVNDECLTALPLVVNADESCNILNENLSLEGATVSTETNPCPATANGDVWYTFTATATSHIIEITNVQGAPVDLVHSVYQGDCDALINIACGDPNQSLVQNLTIGDTYTMRIYSLGNIPIVTTTFDLCIRQSAPPPVNDECDDAIVVEVNPNTSCNINIPGNITGATDSQSTATCAGTADDDVWFKFTATQEVHGINLTDIIGDTTDLVHIVYSGSSCDTLEEIICSDSNSSRSNDFIVGETYFIQVYSFTNQPGQNVNFNLCVNSFETIIVNSINDPESLLSAEELVEQVFIDDFTCGDVNITFTNIAENPDGETDISQRSWGYFKKGNTDFPLEEGIILSSGIAKSAEGPNSSTSMSGNGNNWGGDIDLQAILDNQSGTTVLTNNATVFEFEFTSNLTQASFDFIFASEEYEDDFECTDNFRDGFAFLVKGPGIPNTSGTPFGGTNIAVIEGSNNVPISTVTIHRDTFLCGTEMEGENYFPDLYVSNFVENINDFPIEFDGLTAVLTTATLTLEPGELYTVKMVIGDRGDTAFDSAVFLAGGSFDIGDVEPGADSEAPEINCPEDQVVEINQNTTYMLPDYDAEGIVIATDNCSVNTTITQSPAPGTEVAPGVQTIMFEAFDQSGNMETCSFILQVNEVLGVNETELSNLIKLFPNPADKYTTLESLLEIENAIIYNLSGQKLMEFDTKTLNVQNLTSGLYFVEIEVEGKRVIKQLMIK